MRVVYIYFLVGLLHNSANWEFFLWELWIAGESQLQRSPTTHGPGWLLSLCQMGDVAQWYSQTSIVLI